MAKDSVPDDTQNIKARIDSKLASFASTDLVQIDQTSGIISLTDISGEAIIQFRLKIPY